ncbi:MAG TPA: hypothetical protein VEY91_01200, partial [Candidatus Limnocylindria bacterium]|nr:hypothetical protein [Candidatus Limnocylindria bacterium]
MEFLWESFPIFRRLLSLVLLSLLIPIGARLSAQGAPASPDPKDHYWWNGFGLPVFDGPIYDLATYDGRLVAAGWFTQASGAIANHVAIWSGDQWHPLGSGPGGPVRRLAIQGKKLHAGGLGGVASWNGTEWTPVGVCPLLDVTALLATDDELVAAGRVGDRSSLVVRWDGETWTSVGDTIRGGVYDLAIYADELIACGDLTIPGDSLCHGLVARFDGVAWRRTLGGRSCFLVVGFGVDDFFATDLTVFGDDLIVSGYFDAVLDGRACSTVLSWDGNRWHCLAAGPPGMFATQLLDLDGQLIVGG